MERAVLVLGGTVVNNTSRSAVPDGLVDLFWQVAVSR